MDNAQNERGVITNGMPNLSLMPSDVLDMIVAVLSMNIEKSMQETE